MMVMSTMKKMFGVIKQEKFNVKVVQKYVMIGMLGFCVWWRQLRGLGCMLMGKL